jgi:hypothetical protein
MISNEEFTTLSRFAAQVGVTPAAVSNWRSRNPKTFPMPVRDLGDVDELHDAALDKAFRSGKLFSRHALVMWARENGRLGQLDVDDDLSPLFAIAAGLGSLSRAADDRGSSRWSSTQSQLTRFALPALAIAAGRIYEFATGDTDWMTTPELAPIAETYEEYRGRGGLAVLELEHIRREMTDRGRWLATIDGLRADFANLTRRGTWSQTLDMAQLVGHTSGPGGKQLRVIDPCCGNGGLLSQLGRRSRDRAGRGSKVELIGRDEDPMQLAIAYALLRAEGFTVSLTLGSPFDGDWVDRIAARQTPTVVATVPRSTLNSSGPAPAPRPGDDWVTLVADRLGSTTIGAAAVKRPWLGGRRLGALHETLLEARRLLAVEYPSTPSDLAFVVVTSADADRSQWPPGVMLTNLQGTSHQEASTLASEVAQCWTDRVELTVEQKIRARIVDEQVLRDRGSLSPPTPPTTTASATPGPRITPSSAPAAESAADEPETGRRTRKSRAPATIATISPGPGRPQREADDRELPRVPLRTLNEIRRLMDSEPDDLTEFDPKDDVPGRTIKDALRDHELVLVPPQEVHLQPEHLRIVQLITSPIGFGHVDLLPVKALAEQDPQRGHVLFAVPFRSKDTRGLSPEFLAGWLSSLRVQRAMRRELDPARQRDTLSMAKVERLPGDFPDADRCLQIATRWTDYERVKAFADRLPAALTEWRLHLADEVEDPPARD